MLIYAVKRRYTKIIGRRTQAVDVLYDKMTTYNTKAKKILEWCLAVVHSGEKAQYDKIKQLMQQMKHCDDLVIDCAHKLAPYQSPKLESLEVKSKVEHRFVVRAPQSIASVEEWAKQTGAEKLKLDQIKRETIKSAIVPSIHDFDTDEDDYNEPGIPRSIN